MKTKKRKANAGLSLIEVMVVSGLLTFFSIFLVSLIVVSQNAWIIQNNAVPVRAEAKRTMESMIKELREGDPSAAGGVVIAGTNDSQITFEVPDEVSQTGISSWRQIQFSYDQGDQEVVRTESGTDTTIGRNVQSLQFVLADSDTITITLGTQRTTAGGTVLQATLTSQVKLRN